MHKNKEHTIASQRFALCFTWLNWLLLCCLMSSYVAQMPNFARIVYLNVQGHVDGWLFFVLGMMGQMALFSLLPYCLMQLLICASRSRRLLMYVAIALMSILQLLLISDTVVYHLYHLHLAGVVWHVIKAGVVFQVFALSGKEWLQFSLLVFVLIILEYFLARLVFSFVKKCKSVSIFRWMSLFAFVALFASYILFSSAESVGSRNEVLLSNSHVIAIEGRLVPYYENILSDLFPGKNLLTSLAMSGYGIYLQAPMVNKPLHYPLSKVVIHPPKHPLNVLFILLDAWRADALTPTVTPNFYRFSQHALKFTQNFSGGDCTRPGIFSLFYSIPENYWTAVLSQKKAPVLMQAFKKSGYQMGVFRSASMNYPQFAKTVFRLVPHLIVNTKGVTAAARDRQITRNFLHFLRVRNQHKPFFGFLFYDESHNYCEQHVHYAMPFKPYVKQCDRLMLTDKTNPLPYINRYHNAVHFDDMLAGKVLAALKHSGVLKHTVVIITADHGEEFNDNGLGYWGHASDYSVYQTHTPMVIYWPGKKPAVLHYPTTHYDIAPFLMQSVLHSTTAPRAYSVGSNILSPTKVPFFIVNSYVDYAILTPKHITRIYPGGEYVVKTRRGIPLPNAQVNFSVLKQAFAQLMLYFK